MDELKQILTKLAPVLGGAVGGPLGSAVVSILAEVFGTNANVDDVTAVIKSENPDVVKASLERATAAFKAAAEEQVTLRTQIDKHVEMVRLDYDRGTFYSAWRPLAGWIAVLFSAAIAFVVIKDAWAGSYGLLMMSPQLLMILGPSLALAGIYSYGKTQERVAMSGGRQDQGSIVDAVRSMLPSGGVHRAG
jgi:hypothetical protein